MSTPCNLMDCSSPSFPVLHHLAEFVQTQDHWLGDSIQLSHPLLRSSPLALSLPQHQGLFQWVCSSQQVAKVLSFCINPSLHPIYQQILLALPSVYVSSWPLSSTSASLTPSPFFWISLITSKLVFLLPFLLPYNLLATQKQNGFF